MPLFQARRNQTHNPGMPAFRGGDDHSGIVGVPQRCGRFGLGLGQGRLLDHLALTV